MLNILKNKENRTVIFNIAPGVRIALMEDFNNKLGINVDKKIVSALKCLGADYVFDVTFGANLTIMEEANELIERIKTNNLPMFTSCCPAWVSYAEIFYSNNLKNLSSCKSPIAMQSSLIKTYFGDLKNINPKDIINIVVAPCTAKKAEIKRMKLNVTSQDTDYVLTTRELAKLFKESKINIEKMNEIDFDAPLELGSSSGLIFGRSGGVSTAIIQTAYFLMTGKNLKNSELEFKDLQGFQGIKITTVKLLDKELKVAVCNGMSNAKRLIDRLNNKEEYYDFVEVMNCNGGCATGGGQPKITLLKMRDTKEKRVNTLNKIDKKSKIRLCHENPYIKKIYNEYLDKPGSEKAKALLHTKYEDKSVLLGGTR